MTHLLLLWCRWRWGVAPGMKVCLPGDKHRREWTVEKVLPNWCGSRILFIRVSRTFMRKLRRKRIKWLTVVTTNDWEVVK